MKLSELIRYYNHFSMTVSGAIDDLESLGCDCSRAEEVWDTIDILRWTLKGDGRDHTLSEADIELDASPSPGSPWRPLTIDRDAEHVLLDGQPVPEGALLELMSDCGPVAVRLCEASRAAAYARLELHADGAHDRLPVTVRLYSGVLARLAHPAEGRRD